MAEGYVVPPFKFEGRVQDLLRRDLMNQLADEEVRELYPKALDEGLTINSRAPMLALAAYSLIKMGRVLEANGYARAYSREVKGLALELFSIAVDDLRTKSKESEVVEVIELRADLAKTRDKKPKKEVLKKKEEDVLKSFISEAYKTLVSSTRVPPTARAVLSYLFVKWSEKVSFKLALMAANNRVSPHKAFALLLVPC